MNESDCIYYKDGYKAQLVKPAYFYLYGSGFNSLRPIDTDFYSITPITDTMCLVTGKTGYAWNFGNWPAINTPAMKFASCGHDIICQAVQQGVLPLRPYRLFGDRMFQRLLLKCGVWTARAAWCFAAVKKAGEHQRKIGETIRIAP